MNIRPATTADAALIAELHAASWRVAYRNVLKDAYLDGDILSERVALWNERMYAPDEGQHILIAESDGEAVGFTCVYVDHDAEWGNFVDNLHVRQAHWRAGIGAALMVETARLCRAHARSRGMYLWVLESNDRARRFYERMGAAIDGHELWHPPDGSELPALRCVWRDVDSLLPRANTTG